MMNVKINSVWQANSKSDFRFLKIIRIERMGVMRFVHARECNMYGYTFRKRRTRINMKRFVKLFSPFREEALEGEVYESS